MRIISILTLLLFSAFSFEAKADVGKVFGNTIILNTKFCAYGHCSHKSFKFYFLKDGERAFEEEEFYGKKLGVVYSLGEKACHTYPYSFVSEGKKTTGEMHTCGSLNYTKDTITLINHQNDIRTTPGWGTSDTQSIHTIKLRISKGSKCRLLSLTRSHKTQQGKNKIKESGNCNIKKGKHL